MNIIEQMTHRTIPLHETLWTPFNIVPVAGMALLMPLLFWRIHLTPSGSPDTSGPAEPNLPPKQEMAETPPPPPERTPAEKIEQSPWITVLLVLMGLGYLYTRLSSGTFSMDLNMMIFFLLMIG